MQYIYSDEDNAPMNDDAMREDPWLKYTTYSCKAEADAWENGDIDRHLEDLENARDIRRSQIYEGFLDDLEIPRGSACRNCPWMKEGIMEEWEHEVDDDLIFPPFVYELAHRMCAVCNEHKDDDENARYDAIQRFFEEEENGTDT